MYTYHKSKILGEGFKINKKDNSIIFDSGVVYSSHEISKIKGTPPKIQKKIHQIKKIFAGSTIQKSWNIVK